MYNQQATRRAFLAVTAAAGAAVTAAASPSSVKPALLGGSPVRRQGFPAWPVFDQKEEQALLEVLRSGMWNRGYGQNVNRFEASYAELMGAKHCLATANGTSALIVSMSALGIGAGDEVILPPYTFVASVNAILMLNALPVFADSDPETFQIDARKLEAAITGRTAAIMDVAHHLAGDELDHVGRDGDRALLRLGPQDRDARLEVGRGEVGNEPPLEAAAEALLEGQDRLGRAIRR